MERLDVIVVYVSAADWSTTAVDLVNFIVISLTFPSHMWCRRRYLLVIIDVVFIKIRHGIEIEITKCIESVLLRLLLRNR